MTSSKSAGSERVGIYPGSFNPPTRAHLAISEAALHQRRLDRVVWSLSITTLDKEHVDHPAFDDRVSVLRSVAEGTAWLSVAVTEAQLLADIAHGYDVLIMGADKWAQINEPRWYEGPDHQRAALSALPELAIAPRPPAVVPPEHELTVEDHAETSSTAARAGATHLMLPAARRFAERTGAWIDRERYDAFTRRGPRS